MGLPIIVVICIVALALGVFFVAMRGGPRGARDALQTGRSGETHASGSHSPFGQQAPQRGLTAVLVVVCAFGLVVPALVLAFNAEHKASVAVGPTGAVHLDANQQKGRELFSHACNLCHTLAAANAVGRIGPDLDVLIPTIHPGPPENEAHTDRMAFILSAILEGRARGRGQMPALLYQGREAEDVANFVAAVAGR